ncbi:MAG: PD-(D/E)XK nuclease family protein, partial [Tepidisphaeraceae bacterium]
DLGTTYHGVLERLVREIIEQRADWNTIRGVDYEERIHQLSEDVARTLRGEILLSSARSEYVLRRIETTLRRIVDSQFTRIQRGRFRPWRTELAFGIGPGRESLPPLKLTTPAGNTVLLRGKIDRVDIAEDQNAFLVVDYKLRGTKLDPKRVYYGLSLQLLTYLLVLESHSELLRTDKRLTPAGAIYVPLTRGTESVPHPSREPAEDRPRGAIERGSFESIDSAAKPYRADLWTAEELAELLAFARSRIVEVADQIISGRIEIAPYRSGTQTPCGNCAYRSVCRFDTAHFRYNWLKPVTRSDLVAGAAKGDDDE